MKSVMPLDKLKGLVFKIPHYQRGYRWGEKEVQLLMDDLIEFMNFSSKEDSYCLQPLVFKKLSYNEFRVVDGQQRLTTIWLLMKAMKLDPKWTIRYEYLPDEPEIFEPLPEDKDSTDINRAFRWEAFNVMRNWKGDKKALSSLLNGTSGKRIVFIKYLVQANENEHKVFDRLNNGKIPLTTAELIRALFMSSLPVNDTMEIAKEWELIEDSLRDPEMWEVFSFHQDKHLPVRLELLFQATSKVTENEIKRDNLAVYHDLEHKYVEATGEAERRDILQKKWKEVLECFWWMNDCQKDAVAYNFLGWIALFSNNSLKTIHSWWKNDCRCNMTKFKQKLRKIIVPSHSLQPDDIIPDFSEWRYGSDNMKQFLLLLNVLECNSQITPVRFRFDAYLKEKGWDVEHIHSQTYGPIKDLSKEKQKAILTSAKEILSQEQARKFENIRQPQEKINFLDETFRIKDLGFDENAPGNLALLDLSTNRAYKNAWFPVKRSWIIQESRQGRFIPPCTLSAFMKFFDESPKSLVSWDTQDSKAYGDAMKKLYDDFKEQFEREEQA